MKLYRDENFDKEINIFRNKKLLCHRNAEHSLSDLKEGEFYLLNLKVNGTIKSNRCLYIIKNGVLHLHKGAFWKDCDGNDLNINNYLPYDSNNEYFEYPIFLLIPTEDFICSDYKRI